jgi:hypothetical protein
MISYQNIQTMNHCWKGSTAIERKAGMDPLVLIRQWIENFFVVQQKRKRFIKGIWNGELIFKIGTAFGGFR